MSLIKKELTEKNGYVIEFSVAEEVYKKAELAAYKKAAHYAQTFEEPALKTLASTVATHHKTRFDKLSTYLSSHAN